MNQNLISASLSPEDAAKVQQNLKDAKTGLSFLLSLKGSDIQGMIKLGNAYMPFIDKIYNTVTEHPEIFPLVFDKEEFIKDYNLLKTMAPILNQINELQEGLQKTFYAVGSDTLVSALHAYTSVKQQQDKVAGLKSTADELAMFFKKAKTEKIKESIAK